jgi:hypothetical protein
MLPSSRQSPSSPDQKTNEILKECDAEALVLIDRHQEEVGVSSTFPLLQRMTLESDMVSLVGFYPFEKEPPTDGNQRRPPMPTLDAGKQSLAGDLDTFLQNVAKKMTNPKRGMPFLPHSKPITEAARDSNINRILAASNKRRAYAMKLDGERVFFLYLHSEMFEVTIRYNEIIDEDEIEYHRITDDPLLSKALKRCGFVGLFLDSESMKLETSDHEKLSDDDDLRQPKRQKLKDSADVWTSKPILEQHDGGGSHKTTSRQNSHTSLQVFDVYWAAFSNPSMGARGSLVANQEHPAYLYGDDISDRFRWMNSYIPLVNSLFDPVVTLLVETKSQEPTDNFYTWDGFFPSATEESMNLPKSFRWPNTKHRLEDVSLGRKDPQMVSPNFTFPRPTNEPIVAGNSGLSQFSLLARGPAESPLNLVKFSVGGVAHSATTATSGWEIRRCVLRYSASTETFTAHPFPEPVRYPRFTPLSSLGSKWSKYPSQRVSDLSDVDAARNEARQVTKARGAQSTSNRRSLWPKAAWLDQADLFGKFEVESSSELNSKFKDGSQTTVQAKMNFVLDGEIKEASVACDGELTRTLGQVGLTSTQSLFLTNPRVPVPDIKEKFNATIDITTSLVKRSMKDREQKELRYRTLISRKKHPEFYTDEFDQDNKIDQRGEKLSSLYVHGDTSGNKTRVDKLEELFAAGRKTQKLTNDQQFVVVEYAMRFTFDTIEVQKPVCYLVPIGLRTEKSFSNARLTYINTWNLCRSYYNEYLQWRGPQLVADFTEVEADRSVGSPAVQVANVALVADVGNTVSMAKTRRVHMG